MDGTAVAVKWPILMAVSLVGALALHPAMPTQDDEVPQTTERAIEEFLKSYCLKCHGAQPLHNDFRIAPLIGTIGEQREAWRSIASRIRDGEMPPVDAAERPDAETAQRAAEYLFSRIAAADAQHAPSGNVLRWDRLTRQELTNTWNALLGVAWSADELNLQDDDHVHGIRRIGSVLTTSTAHIERIIAAAELVLNEAYPQQTSRPVTYEFDAAALAGGEALYGQATLAELRSRPPSKRARLDLWPRQHSIVPIVDPCPAGLYSFSIRLSGLQSKDGRAPHLVLRDHRSDRILFEKDVVADEGKPLTLSFEIHLKEGPQQVSLNNEANGPLMLASLPRTARPFFSIHEGYVPWQIDLVDANGQLNAPTLLIDSLTINGPLVSDQALAVRRQWMPIANREEDIARCLELFCSQAFRRPLSSDELERYSQIARSELERGESLNSAIKLAMLSALCSPDALFVTTDSRADRNPVRDCWSLASRLSYFIWSAPPDDELRRLAAEGRLLDSSVLSSQIQRMLDDPRAAHLARDFASQWLQLHRVGMFKPNAKIYPDSDGYLERCAVRETTLFFERMLRDNLSLVELVDSDWALINPRLARHYELELPTGRDIDEFRLVVLPADRRRGGIITQASVLSMTSDGLRQRPVHRGAWFVETLLGRPVPAPPANVAAIEPVPDDQPRTTFRDQLIAHTSQPACASCHSKIDPYGFAFENFDAVGKWRTVEFTATGTGDTPSVDASGVLPNGKSFTGIGEFRDALRDDLDSINAALVSALASYATRRLMSAEDTAALAEIAAASRDANYRWRELIEALLRSELFRKG